MNDIPIFEASGGVASLILQDIPGRRAAYVIIRAAAPGKTAELLTACADRCRELGAETVLASGNAELSNWPHAYDLILLEAERSALPAEFEPVPLTPVTVENAEQFLTVYDRAFRERIGAPAYTEADARRLCREGSGWLAYQDGACAGIGEISGSTLCTLAVLPEYRGIGRRLALTLLQRMEGERLYVQTASDNRRALRLYESLGFRRLRTVTSWYRL